MSMPPAAQGCGGESVGAGPSSSPCGLTPAVSGLLSGVTQPVQLTMSNTDYSDPSASRYQELGLAPSRAERRFIGADPLGTQHAQVGFLTQHAHENQPTPNAYPLYPAIPTDQYPAAVPADMQRPSSYTHRDSVVSLYSEDSLQLPSSSALPDTLDSTNPTLSPRHASPGTPSYFTGHKLPQQDTLLTTPEALRQKRRAVQRKRIANPKDPKAAERLQNQRQSDDKDIEYLYKLFVPDSEGEVPKKDRLRLSTSQSLCLAS